MQPRIHICAFIYSNKSDKCLQIIPALDYPKDLIQVTVFSDRKIDHPYTHQMMSEKEAYQSLRYQENADYLFFIHADYIIQSTSILNDLLKTKKDIVSGLMVQPNTIFSNFWGAVSESGWYQRSENYVNIVERKNAGTFDVPYIHGNILFKTEAFKRNEDITREHKDWDIDMNICFNLRTNGEKMYVLNTENYGYIEETNITPKANLLGEWAGGKYLDPKFSDFLAQFKADRNNVKTDVFKSLGPDIWQFPIFKEEFCDYLIDLAEKKNDWSKGVYSGKNEIDPRLGTVENYPTQDVHMKQLGLHDWWLNTVVGDYFKAVLSHLYSYRTKGYNIAFMVKYTPDGQSKLDAHHDASAYTTNIALNHYGKDYTGGGCNFVHKKVECVGNLKGHLIMHPGRITHYHEAYPVKTGKRYILVSFND
jgi:hypothetical protein